MTTTAISIYLSDSLLGKITKDAETQGRPLANYIRFVMSEYVKNFNETEFQDSENKHLKTTGWQEDKQKLAFVIRLPKPLKEEFYRIAELQGYKGSSLIKILLQKETTQP